MARPYTQTKNYYIGGQCVVEKRVLYKALDLCGIPYSIKNTPATIYVKPPYENERAVMRASIVPYRDKQETIEWHDFIQKLLPDGKKAE